MRLVLVGREIDREAVQQIDIVDRRGTHTNITSHDGPRHKPVSI